MGPASPSGQDVRDLDLHEDERFQRRTWRVQRIGWVAMALFVLAALLGIFANGPVSRAMVRDPAAGVTVEYDRFLRLGSPTTLRVRFEPGAVRDGQVALRLATLYTEAIGLEWIRPRPERSVAGPDGLVLLFSAAEEGRGAIELSINPREPGFAHGEIALLDRGTLRFRQFVYP